MSGADSSSAISPSDRELMRRLAIVLAFLFFFTAAFTRLELLYSHKFFDVTGTAQWIWDEHRLAAGMPLAFFATRDFDLPPNRYYTRIKIAGDPEYTLYFNGQELGGRQEGEQAELDVYDVTKLARTNGNRIVVALRSVNGVGGLIVSIDNSQETQNVLVTSRDWRIVRRWTPDLLLRDTPGATASPMLLGRPPARRWNYLDRREAQIEPPPATTIPPRESFDFDTKIPQVKVVSGVAVGGSTPIHATAFDFGPAQRGRLRLTLKQAFIGSRVVNVRFANNRDELTTIEGSVRPFIFAAGEKTIVDPELREFRYAMVYGSEAAADVVR